jgi:hypothetical protein
MEQQIQLAVEILAASDVAAGASLVNDEVPQQSNTKHFRKMQVRSAKGSIYDFSANRGR